MEFEELTPVTVNIADLSLAPWYPAERALESTETLRKSIEEWGGLAYPLLVTRKHMIVDGHRRLKVGKELGWIEIPVVYAEDDQDDEDVRGMFIDANIVHDYSDDKNGLSHLPLTGAQIVRLSFD